MRWVLGILLGLLVVVVGAFAIGARRWAIRTEALVLRLDRPSSAAAPTPADPDAVANLPAPVQRYFRTVLPEGAAPIARVRLRHRGEFKASDAPDGWKPFTSDQWVRATPPGFVWSARVRMAPFMDARVHDAYVEGEGILQAYLAGLAPVMRAEPTPDLAMGELLRWLAEAAWYPTALLPRPGLTWRAVDEQTAVVTLQDGLLTVALTVSFGDDGLIDRVRADRRMRETPDGPIATPWEGRFWAYTRRDGMLVPSRGEVAWVLPTGLAPYWRGEIVDAEYTFAR